MSKYMLRKKPKVPPPAETRGFWREKVYGPPKRDEEEGANDQNENV